jgi:hypothetical protein
MLGTKKQGCVSFFLDPDHLDHYHAVPQALRRAERIANPTPLLRKVTMTLHHKVRARGRLHALRICVAAVCGLSTLVASSARAQDSHYWNLFYGTYPTLLGGTVTGSPSDLAGSYYNPGFRPANKTGELLLAAQLYQYERLTLEGNAGTRLPLSGSSIAVSPSLIAGNFPGMDTASTDRFTYSLLARQHANFDIEGRITTGGTSKADANSSELILNQNLSEYWAGFTWTRQFNPTWSAGVTNYIAFRSQTQRLSLSVRQYDDTTSATSALSYTNLLDYYHVRLLWKLGVGYREERFSAGATVTTPSLSLLGSGEYYLDQGLEGYPPTPTFFAASSQKDLTPTYRSSWAVGAGLAYTFDDVKVYLSAEWYAPVSRYNILDTKDFVAASSGNPVSAAVVQELRPVFNYGAGVEVFPGQPWSFLASFVTDQSAVDPNVENTTSFSTWDLYHIAGGGIATFGRYRLTLGGAITIGSGKARTLTELAGLIGETTGLVKSTAFEGNYFRAQIIAALSVAL